MSELSKSPAAGYDAVPYPAAAKTATHPCHLATLAYLHGMTPPPLAGCRVLELGCASGGNLIPMASFLPKSRFTGIDISPRQIEQGREVVRALGLENIDLQTADVRQIDKSWGEFDYIITHGLFSWVPPEVQHAILRICRDNLAAGGLAYISYNIYPGWHMRGIVRDFMTYHTRTVDEPAGRIGAAIEGLEALQELVTQANTQHAERLAYELILKSGWLNSREQHPAYVYHEFLEDENNPLYFYQFAELLSSYGLKTITDTKFPLTAAAAELSGLEQLTGGSPVGKQVREQYLDFLHYRSFRRSLITHQAVTVSDYLLPERIAELGVAALVRPDAAAVAPHEPAAFFIKNRHSGQEERLTTGKPLEKALWSCLAAAWPGIIGFRELLVRINAGLSRSEPAAAVTQPLAGLYAKGLVELYYESPAFKTEPCPHPEVNSLTRYQAAQGPVVTNPLHEDINLADDRLCGMLLPYLDGHTDMSALKQLMQEWIAQGIIRINIRNTREDAPLPESQQQAQLDALLTELVARCLQRLLSARLLIN